MSMHQQTRSGNNMHNKDIQNKNPRPARRGGGPGALMPGGEKAKDFRTSMSKLIKYMGRHKWPILIAMLIASASTVFPFWAQNARTSHNRALQRRHAHRPKRSAWHRLCHLEPDPPESDDPLLDLNST